MKALFTSIFNFGKSIVDGIRERKARQAAEKIEAQKRDEQKRLDDEAARIAGKAASIKQKMAYDNRRELNHRP